ncbi:methyl-accepting chemotaxis protein [Methanocella sp. MCL-LM]|uniref:methyl-accepting chemotaxis protein n=1 Tax=Methanocella sp. MCL-LM TaxID=3412035 RepID=UPI003C76115D
MKLDLRSISVQLIVLVLIVAIVPVLALTAYTYNTMTVQKYAEFKGKVGDIGTIGELSYNDQMDNLHVEALKIGNDARMSAAIKSGDKAAVKRLVDEFKGKNQWIDIITVADKDAVILGRSASTVSGDVSTNSFVRRAITGDDVTATDILAASAVQSNNLADRTKTSGTSDGLTIASAIPIKDDNGAVVGVIYVAVLQNDYNNLVDTIATNSDGFCSVFQGDTRIATSLKDQSGQRTMGTKADPAVVSRVLNNGETVADIFPVNGKQLYVHYSPLKNQDGKTIGMLAVGYDIGPGLAELSNLTFILIGIGAVISLIGAVAGFVVVNRVTRPINKLVVASNSIAAGNLDTVIDTGAKGGEVGELTTAVTQMVANIKERIAFNESILKGISTPMFVTDNDRKITYFNQAASKLTDVSSSDAVGRYCKDIFNTPVCNTEKCAIKCAWRDGDQKGVEIATSLKGGKSAVLSVDASSIKDQNGKVVGGLEILHDITESKQAQIKIEHAEKEAREKALFSESILKAITDAHFVIDNKGNITYINEVAQKLLGWSEREAMGKNFDDVIGVPNSKTKQALVEHTNVYNADGYVVARNGKKIPVRVNDTLLKDLTGNVTGINAMFRDITQEQESKRQLKEITLSANTIAEKVAGASGNVSTAVQQVMTSSRQISESIQQIAGGSQTQARSIDEINHLMHDMSKSISQVTDGAKKTSEDAVKANAEARKGSENAKVAIKKMDELHGAVNDSAKIVQDLGEKSKQIGQIVEMITAIAGQTNLLALNAAIEAARAGEAGRGFAVVAEEVRKLAEESAKAADEINKLIGEVRDQTAKAVESMNRGTHEVEESNKVVAESLKSLEGIGRLIDTTAAKAQEIAAMTEKQAADTDKVAKAVESMAAVIEESASGSEEVSASSEETTSTAEQVAGMAAELAKIADELKAEVGKLKTE